MLIEQMSSSEYRSAMLLYTSAIKTINTRLDIINEEKAAKHQYNPIEHVKSRLKSPQSITRKLIKKGYEPTIENAIAKIDDIAGIRVICSFTEDIYKIANFFEKQSGIRTVRVKDYIKNPKPNGYRSYHMHTVVPVYMSGEVEYAKVEIQIRTIAMDFWASLEHKIRYKLVDDAPQSINDGLLECADLVHFLDEKMHQLNKDIENYLKAIRE